MMAAFDESVFFPVMKAAGMLARARVLPVNASEPMCADVEFMRPDVDLLGGHRSREYCIDYQSTDLPGLTEGAQVEITENNGTVSLFTVRADPFVLEVQPSGYFLRALLTARPAG